ncbi:hypothetical protein ACNKHX_16430 [Shigella flexneri]
MKIGVMLRRTRKPLPANNALKLHASVRLTSVVSRGERGRKRGGQRNPRESGEETKSLHRLTGLNFRSSYGEVLTFTANWLTWA